MKIKPLNDWAVIVPDTAETRTAGGIFIPDTAQNKPDEGVVEAIGPGALEEKGPKRGEKETKKERKFVPTTVQPGEHVCYEKYAARRVTIGQVDYVLVRERDILGVMPERQQDRRDDPPSLQNPLLPVTAGDRMLMKRADAPVALADQHRSPALKPARPARKTAAKSGKKAAKKAGKKKTATTAAKRTARKKQAVRPSSGAKKGPSVKKAKKKR